MTDSIRAMSQEFARDPDSLVFLRLGEALRVKGELEAASSVALAGLERYPDLPEGRDLYARVLVDMGHLTEARQVWEGVVEMEPRHVGAHKGLGFLFYSEGNIDAALDHLEIAISADPTDESAIQALRLVRAAAADAEDDASEVADEPAGVFAGFEGTESMLLVDGQGRPLGGGIRIGSEDRSEHVAAYLTGVAQEAERAARILELGHWQWIMAEGGDANLHLTQPTPGTRLLVMRDRSIPTGRLAFQAARANAAAREWLDGQPQA